MLSRIGRDHPASLRAQTRNGPPYAVMSRLAVSQESNLARFSARCADCTPPGENFPPKPFPRDEEALVRARVGRGVEERRSTGVQGRSCLQGRREFDAWSDRSRIGRWERFKGEQIQIGRVEHAAGNHQRQRNNPGHHFRNWRDHRSRYCFARTKGERSVPRGMMNLRRWARPSPASDPRGLPRGRWASEAPLEPSRRCPNLPGLWR